MKSVGKQAAGQALLVGVVAMILACGGAGNKGSKSSGPSVKIGEEVVFDDSKWTVTEAKDVGKTLKSNNRFQKDAQTDGRFILVRFKVTNATKKEEQILATPKLIDSQGREFQEYENQTFFLPEGAKSMGLKPLPASMTKEFGAIYEVPADAKGLKFQARALSVFGETKQVDLGF